MILDPDQKFSLIWIRIQVRIRIQGYVNSFERKIINNLRKKQFSFNFFYLPKFTVLKGDWLNILKGSKHLNHHNEKVGPDSRIHRKLHESAMVMQGKSENFRLLDRPTDN